MVFTCEAVSWGLSTGKYLTISRNLKSDLQSAIKQKFDYICLPLFYPNYLFTSQSLETRNEPLAKSDQLIESQYWKNIISVINCDNLDPDNDQNSPYYQLKLKIEYSIYLNVYAILINLPCKEQIKQLATLLNEIFSQKQYSSTQLWLNIPLICTETFDTWQNYNELRCLLDPQIYLGVSLVIQENLPPQNYIERWFGENLKSVIVSTNLYITNQKGFPILTKPHESLIKRLFKFKISITIRGTTPIDNLADDRECNALELADKLQIPLQPTKDNLLSETYAIFEDDRVKYETYENALFEAYATKFKNQDRIVIFYCGAGRGALMRSALRAAQRANANIFIYLLEKNPNAVITLKYLVSEYQDELGQFVKIISCDFRKWIPEEKADIILTELLGSFGDNELSPELINSMEKYLKEDGISIPQSYSSYLTPICCQSVYKKILINSQNKLNYPYVVYLNKYYRPSNIQECFTFCHPNQEINNFERKKNFTFKFKENNYISGIAGYFDSKLFGSISFSICPNNPTKEMLSWFPIFFPFEKQLYIQCSEELEIIIQRKTNDKFVWYTWQAIKRNSSTQEIVYESNVQNENADSFQILK